MFNSVADVLVVNHSIYFALLCEMHEVYDMYTIIFFSMFVHLWLLRCQSLIDASFGSLDNFKNKSLISKKQFFLNKHLICINIFWLSK